VTRDELVAAIADVPQAEVLVVADAAGRLLDVGLVRAASALNVDALTSLRIELIEFEFWSRATVDGVCRTAARVTTGPLRRPPMNDLESGPDPTPGRAAACRYRSGDGSDADDTPNRSRGAEDLGGVTPIAIAPLDGRPLHALLRLLRRVAS